MDADISVQAVTQPIDVNLESEDTFNPKPSMALRISAGGTGNLLPVLRSNKRSCPTVRSLRNKAQPGSAHSMHDKS